MSDGMDKWRASLAAVLTVLVDVAWEHSREGEPDSSSINASDLISEFGEMLDIPPDLITSASVAVALRMLRDRVGA